MISIPGHFVFPLHSSHETVGRPYVAAWTAMCWRRGRFGHYLNFEPFTVETVPHHRLDFAILFLLRTDAFRDWCGLKKSVVSFLDCLFCCEDEAWYWKGVKVSPDGLLPTCFFFFFFLPFLLPALPSGISVWGGGEEFEEFSIHPRLSKNWLSSSKLLVWVWGSFGFECRLTFAFLSYSKANIPAWRSAQENENKTRTVMDLEIRLFSLDIR